MQRGEHLHRNFTIQTYCRGKVVMTDDRVIRGHEWAQMQYRLLSTGWDNSKCSLSIVVWENEQCFIPSFLERVCHLATKTVRLSKHGWSIGHQRSVVVESLRDWGMRSPVESDLLLVAHSGKCYFSSETSFSGSSLSSPSRKWRECRRRDEEEPAKRDQSRLLAPLLFYY